MSDTLPAAPFAAWIEWHVREHDTLEALARACGVDSEDLRHILRFRRPVDLALVDRCTTLVGADTLWTLYPDPQAAPRRGGGKPVGKYRRMTDEQVRAAYRLHIEGGLSLRELGRRLYERFGYSSPQSLTSCLSAAFDSLGLDARDRLEAVRAVSTVHGLARRGARDSEHTRAGRVARGEILDRPRCAGVRTQYPRKGQSCGNRALAGSEFCWAHDPARTEEREAILLNARSRPAA